MSETANGSVCKFVHKFRTKLSYVVDDPNFWLEYGIAGHLDPRQSKLKRYKVIWTDLDDDKYVNWLPLVRDHFGNFDNFYEQV